MPLYKCLQQGRLELSTLPSGHEIRYINCTSFRRLLTFTFLLFLSLLMIDSAAAHPDDTTRVPHVPTGTVTEEIESNTEVDENLRADTDCLVANIVLASSASLEGLETPYLIERAKQLDEQVLTGLRKNGTQMGPLERRANAQYLINIYEILDKRQTNEINERNETNEEGNKRKAHYSSLEIEGCTPEQQQHWKSTTKLRPLSPGERRVVRMQLSVAPGVTVSGICYPRGEWEHQDELSPLAGDLSDVTPFGNLDIWITLASDLELPCAITSRVQHTQDTKRDSAPAPPPTNPSPDPDAVMTKRLKPNIPVGCFPNPIESDLDYDYALLSQHVYGRDGVMLPRGWKLLGDQRIPAVGFHSALYYNGQRNEYVLAFEGTDPESKSDIISDIIQSQGIPEGQYDAATEIAERLRETIGGVPRFTLVGHSLGGGLASVAAVVNNEHAVTFNAAGVHTRTIMMYFTLRGRVGSALSFRRDQPLIRAYYVQGEILTATQDNIIVHVVPADIPPALGIRHPLSPHPEDVGADPKYLHKMDVVLRAMRWCLPERSDH